MKIAYINFVKDGSSGIAKRMAAMASGAARAGIGNIDFFYLSRLTHPQARGIVAIKVKEALFPLNYYQFLFRRYHLIEQIPLLSDYDYLILRYLSGDPSGSEFASRHQVITEHHSFEIQEYETQLKRRLSLPVKGLKKIRLALEKRYGTSIVGATKGIVGVTNEIRHYEVSRTGCQMPSTVIRNGISVADIEPTGFKPFDGRVLKLGLAAAVYAPWHGIERLIRSAQIYKGPVKIELYLIGNLKPADLTLPCNGEQLTIRFCGPLYGRRLDEVMAQMNLGVSTLALLQKGMTEACSLKTREYVARGLPFIMAYKDGDLDAVDPGMLFFWDGSNYQADLPMSEIIAFAKEVTGHGVRLVSETMRRYAAQYLDWQVKMRQYVDFVRQL
jgi:hypothetical protein